MDLVEHDVAQPAREAALNLRLWRNHACTRIPDKPLPLRCVPGLALCRRAADQARGGMQRRSTRCSAAACVASLLAKVAAPLIAAMPRARQVAVALRALRWQGDSDRLGGMPGSRQARLACGQMG